jgi:hypothetical protein
MAVSTPSISYTISQDSDKYPDQKIQIQTWFAEKNEIDNRYRSEVVIKKETEKAYLMEFITGVQEEHWVPKSLGKIVKVKNSRLGDF